MRTILASICLLSLVIPAAILPGSYPSDYAGSTVKIDLPGGHGSGVYLGKSLILTARHVVHDETSITIKTDKGATVGAKILWESAEYDVALLELKGPLRLKESKLACRDVYVGEALEVHGNPLNNDFVVTWGYVSKLPHTIQDWKSVAMADLTIAGGNSGGPAFNWWGRVVGIMVGGYDYPPLSVFVPSSVICNLMDGMSK